VYFWLINNVFVDIQDLVLVQVGNNNGLYKENIMLEISNKH